MKGLNDRKRGKRLEGLASDYSSLKGTHARMFFYSFAHGALHPPRALQISYHQLSLMVVKSTTYHRDSAAHISVPRANDVGETPEVLGSPLGNIIVEMKGLKDRK